jgi:hypothetical protein
MCPVWHSDQLARVHLGDTHNVYPVAVKRIPPIVGRVAAEVRQEQGETEPAVSSSQLVWFVPLFGTQVICWNNVLPVSNEHPTGLRGVVNFDLPLFPFYCISTTRVSDHRMLQVQSWPSNRHLWDDN